jgi:type IV secretion system protein VirB8
MKMKAREALDSYYEQAETWGKDRQDSLRASRRLAWIVASVAVFIAVVEAIAIAQLTPLKTVEPLTLLVDKNTGYVQALKPLDAATISGNTALTQSFLVQYVIGRESFDIATLQDNYRKVSLWSEGGARTDYVNGVQSTNPDSFLARLPRSTVVETRVKSVTPMANNTAMVRFDTIRHDAGAQPQPAQSWVAVIRYRYSGEPMRVEDRYINPLGFQVQHYQRNAEAVNPEPAATATDAEPGVVAPGAAQGQGGVVIPKAQPSPDPGPGQPGHRLPDGSILTL